MAYKDPEKKRAYQAAWHAAHREEERAKSAEYRAMYPDKVRASCAAYDAVHREERRAYAAAFAAANPEKIRARAAAYRGSHPTEAKVEKYLVDRVELLGGMCPKFSDPGRRGAPDRLVCLPGHPTYFVELKRPKLGKLDAHQIRYHASLRAAGQRVWVIWSSEGVDDFFAEI
jgi:hypothetical protein